MSQEFDKSNFVRYTRLNGLSNNFISGIAQDSTGYIWIATHKGLNRFDGKMFQTFFKGSAYSPLPDNLLLSMYNRCADEIIGATRAGAFALDPITGRYKRFIVPSDSTIFFWTNCVLDVLQDKSQHYIVSTKTGLYVFDNDAHLIKRYDHHVPADVGTKEMIFGGWLSLLTDGSTLQQNGLLGSIYDPVSNSIDTSYVAEREGLKKLIATKAGDLKMSWSGKNDELFIANWEKNALDVVNIRTQQGNSVKMPFSVELELGWNSKLSYISDTLFAMTCKGSGFYLFHYNPATASIFCDGVKYFEGSSCTIILKDREGRLWVGTADGLYKQNLRNSFFSVVDLSLQMPELIDHQLRCIYTEGSTLYAGLQNDGGLLVMNKNTGQIQKQIQFAPKDLFSNTVTQIFPYHPDTLWLGTYSGIIWLNKKNYHFGKVAGGVGLDWIQQSNPRYLLEDSRKNIWISFGKLNSVLKFDRNRHGFSEISTTQNPLLRVTYIFSMAEDFHGNIWLAGDGLCRWNTDKQMIDTLIPYPKVSRSLRNYMFILDHDKNDNLWLSSFDNEIIQFNCTSREMYLRQQENKIIDGNAITNSPVVNDNIWMGTDNGISAFNVKNYSIKQFTYADGLPSVAITSLAQGSYYEKLANRFYIGAMHRLISFTPDVTLSHQVPPQLFIEKINLHDSLIQPVPAEIRLKYYQDNLIVDFNTINFTDPEENRFAWRMIDIGDTAWNDLNDQTSIILTNLPGGWHSVQLKLYSVNNHWSQQTKTLRFYIQPPFWKEPWFVFMMVALIALIIYIVYKRRVNAVRQKEREGARVQQLIAEEYKNQFELEQVSNYFSSSIAGIRDVEEVLWDVTRNLIGHMNYVDCIIYMWNDNKTRMVQKAAFGPKGDPDSINLNLFDVLPGQGIVGHVMLTKEPEMVNDTRKDKRYRIDDKNRLSELCVPIIHNDELIGIIDSEHHEQNHFNERDLKMLTTIATLVGNKIRQIESEHSLEIKQKEIAVINQQLAEAQLSALQTQMNPHFIFNSLNSIKSMILENEQIKASRYLSKFANLIRMTLNQSKEIFTTLYENIEHLDCYLAMEKLRFDDSFSFRITADDDIDKEEIFIPTLMIQPIAENAIWHGLMATKGKKILMIRFYRVEETISCIIEDNGIGIRKSEELKKVNRPTHRSVGLTNLRNRIKILNEKYNTDCTLELTDLQDIDKTKNGTRVILRLNQLINKPSL